MPRAGGASSTPPLIHQQHLLEYWTVGHRRAEATPSFRRLCPTMTAESAAPDWTTAKGGIKSDSRDVAPLMRDTVSVPSLAAHQLRPALLLRRQQALSFLLQFADPRCGSVHGLAGGIVAVHRELKREDELSIDHLVGAEFPDQDGDIILVGAVEIGARRQHPGHQGRDF